MRKVKTRKQKNSELRRRYDAVKNLMSTFAMSTVAVVAVVTLVPASPKAEIIKTVALSDEIVYQVEVTDEENALELDSLTVVLENSLEHYEHPIELGESAGYFDELKTDTLYRLSVYGDKGFGAERLDTEMIRTKPKIGSTILGVTPIMDHHNTIYQVDVSTNDPDSKYSMIELVYGYKWEPDDEELTYNRITLTENREMIELFDVFTSIPFHIFIEGTTTEGTEILDEIWVTPPFNLSASIYIAYLNKNEVSFHAYGDFELDDVLLQMNVYRKNTIIQTSSYTLSNDHHAHNKWVIDELLPDIVYRFECIAVYTNPQTLREEEVVIYDQEHTTSKEYSYTYTIDPVDNTLEVTVTIEDPDELLDYTYFEVLDITGEFEVYLSGESHNFEEIDGKRTVFFTIQIPDVEKYKIFIGMRSYTDTLINHIIEERTNE